MGAALGRACRPVGAARGQPRFHRLSDLSLSRKLFRGSSEGEAQTALTVSVCPCGRFRSPFNDGHCRVRSRRRRISVVAGAGPVVVGEALCCNRFARGGTGRPRVIERLANPAFGQPWTVRHVFRSSRMPAAEKIRPRRREWDRLRWRGQIGLAANRRPMITTRKAAVRSRIQPPSLNWSLITTPV